MKQCHTWQSAFQVSAALLYLPPVALMPLHHGVGRHPHILGWAPFAGQQVHNVGGFTGEPVPHLVSLPCEVAGEGLALVHSRAGLTLPAPGWVVMSVASWSVPLLPVTAVSEWQLFKSGADKDLSQVHWLSVHN